MHGRSRGLVNDGHYDEASSHQAARDPKRRLAVPSLGEEQDVSANHDELLGSEKT